MTTATRVLPGPFELKRGNLKDNSSDDDGGRRTGGGDGVVE